MLSLCPRCNGSVRLVPKSIGTLTGKTGFEGYCSKCCEIVEANIDLKTGKDAIEARIMRVLGADHTV